MSLVVRFWTVEPSFLGSAQSVPARSVVQMRESVAPRSSYQSLHATSHAAASVPSHASLRRLRRKRSCVFQYGSEMSRVRRLHRSMSLGVSIRWSSASETGRLAGMPAASRCAQFSGGCGGGEGGGGSGAMPGGLGGTDGGGREGARPGAKGGIAGGDGGDGGCGGMGGGMGGGGIGAFSGG